MGGEKYITIQAATRKRASTQYVIFILLQMRKNIMIYLLYFSGKGGGAL